MYLILLFSLITNSINPFIDLADTKNRNGETLDSYYVKNKSVYTDKNNSWVSNEFLKDEIFYKELERKIEELYGDDNERCVINDAEKHLAELSKKRPIFHRYLASILVYVRSKTR